MKFIDLALRSEYSFRQTFQHIGKIADTSDIAVGVADLNSTFSHVFLEKICKEKGIKPIFGVRLMVVRDVDERPKGQQGNFGPWYIFLAKNQDGLREIYALVKSAHENFFFRPQIDYSDLIKVSDNIIVIANHFEIEDRIDYVGVHPSSSNKALDSSLSKVFINNNAYPRAFDKKVYELYAGSAKRGDGYSHKFNNHTYSDHVMRPDEFLAFYNDQSCIENSIAIAQQCNVELPKAEMVRYKGNRDLISWCVEGARKRDIDLEDEVYSARLDRELELIKEKDYGDYFLNVAEMIDKAKKKMLVGPARGSSAGSLVCYLMGIVEVDPIPYDLLFERFIDINRLDLPDIDVDFPDNKRASVIRNLSKDHGSNNVSHIATISTFQPKAAIGEFAMGLGISKFETEEVKGAIIERSGGDARAEMCIQDTLESTDIGRDFVNKYPEMKLTSFIEGHASHTGTHAAGIIICNEDLSNYASVNTRDDTIQVEKKSAEYLNLLKIDVLGLRTLSVLEDTAKIAGFDYNDFYDLELDDKDTFEVFNKMRLQGIFQFEGQSLQFITRQIGVNEFNDIVAITSLARPGAMNSGGTARYVKYKLGKEKPVYRNEIHKSITKESMGIVIYQEQMMRMAKEIGDMTWEDVSTLRKAASKSLGDEFFSQFKNKFMKGAMETNGFTKEDSEALWKDIAATGSWTFNKSHAVSYGLVSYWTAWCKAHYPLEFAAANLNNTKDDNSAVRLLRDMVKNEGLEYVAIDPDKSEVKWSIQNGMLYGGLKSIDGIGPKKAQEIVKKRKAGTGFTPSIVNKLLNPKTPFIDIFPCETRYGILYSEYKKYELERKPKHIEKVVDKGNYIVMGVLRKIDLRDRNDYQSVVKRGGKKVDKNQFYLKMFIEDDTDTIMVMISPQDFDKLCARKIAEISKVDKTWFLIKGKIQSDWRMLTIEAIHDITDWRP